MFCTNCGNMVEEGTAFCTKCGFPVGAVKMQPKRDVQYETKREPVPSENNENRSDKNGSVLIVVAVIIALLIIVAAVIFALELT